MYLPKYVLFDRPHVSIRRFACILLGEGAKQFRCRRDGGLRIEDYDKQGEGGQKLQNFP